MARALYIHWPFCIKKCPYCDFNSHVRAEVDYDVWRRAFISDLQHEAALANDGPLASIFFGGGTPSLMPSALVGALLAEAERLFGFAADIEITLEANPSSIEAAKFTDLAKAGVNRVSLGLQALDDADLKFLGRLHSVAESMAALDVAQNNFARVNIDLIYARPDQNMARWQVELERAIAFGTEHLALYQLTIEAETRFATDVRRGVFAPLGDDPSADLFELTRAITSAAGLPPYEISNHARAGAESRHNLTYWRYRDYIGIGPGAHGRRGGIATFRHKKPENWLRSVAEKGHGLKTEDMVTASEQASEALLMNLRLEEGIDLAAMCARFKMPQSSLIDRAKLSNLQRLALVWRDGDRIGVTPQGMPVLDAILTELVHSDLVSVR
ncbi:MAG: radical SAM family heme chaperone HemW [Pontixanthobacter sp.]